MTEVKVLSIEPVNLVSEVLQIKNDNYRLIQICATRIENGFELLYSFGKDYELLNLSVKIDEETEIMSISNIYSPAFLYENEVHDLFGINIKLIALDYQGNLYRTEKKTPFK